METINNEVREIMEIARQRREEMGLKQKEVAKAVFTSDSSYNKYEKGTRNPPEDTLRNICSYFWHPTS